MMRVVGGGVIGGVVVVQVMMVMAAAAAAAAAAAVDAASKAAGTGDADGRHTGRPINRDAASAGIAAGPTIRNTVQSESCLGGGVLVADTTRMISWRRRGCHQEMQMHSSPTANSKHSDDHFDPQPPISALLIALLPSLFYQCGCGCLAAGRSLITRSPPPHSPLFVTHQKSLISFCFQTEKKNIQYFYN